jgi:D-hydroxyproline dehydrogenase subunit beta
MNGARFGDELPASCDVAVVGGGIVGAACTEALSRLGVDVALIERGQLTSGCSGACEGDVLLSDKEPGPELDLGKAGQALYDELAARLPIDIEIEHKGALILNLTADGAAGTAAYVERMQAAGVQARAITGDEARELEPALSPDVAGGAFFPADLQVWPMKVVIGLALAAQTEGARIVCNTSVEGIEIAAGRVTGIRTSRGSVICQAVVMAAGAAGSTLLAGCGVDLPLGARKGQIVVTEPRPGLIRRKIFDAGYTDTVHSVTASLQVSTVLETTHRGNVLIGSSRDATDPDSEARLAVSAAMIRHAVAFVPALAGLRAIRTYAGFRPYLPDSLPAIGKTGRLDGLLLAVGHEGSGINMGPITGELIAELYAGKTPRVDLTAFDPDRFVSDATPISAQPAAAEQPSEIQAG